MKKHNSFARFKRSLTGLVLLSIFFLGGMNAGCSLSSTLTETALTAGVTMLEYVVEALVDSSTTTTSS